MKVAVNKCDFDSPTSVCSYAYRARKALEPCPTSRRLAFVVNLLMLEDMRRRGEIREGDAAYVAIEGPVSKDFFRLKRIVEGLQIITISEYAKRWLRALAEDVDVVYPGVDKLSILFLRF
ncbi:MAG: hypothetical protein ACP5I3_11635 [Thermoproteus sp.]